jgi:predicted PolB exonuclease-like 3'-5' exonuclease
MATLTLNIETVPIPEKIAAQQLGDARVKTYSLSPLWGRVALIGLYPDEGGLSCQRAPQADDEPAVIAWAFAQMAAADRIVTFNGTRFDLPFLRARAILLGVPWPGRLPITEYLRRYATHPHCDVYAVLNHWDYAAAKGTLDEWGQAVGYAPKRQSGAGVWDAYQRGDWAYIEAECYANLERTRTLYERLTAFGQ